MGTLSMKDYSLHFSTSVIDPARPTVLFIHGLVTDSAVWCWLNPLIEHRVNWVTYDRAGHGASDYHAGTPSMAFFLDEALAVIDSLGLKKVHVAGSGLGSLIAFELARHHPDRVTSLTLISSMFYLPEKDFQRTFYLIDQLLDLDRDLLMEKLLLDFFQKSSEINFDIFRGSFQKITNSSIQAELHWMQSAYRTTHFNFAQALAELTVPTLVLHGADDPLVPPQLSAVFAACIPGSRWFPISLASRLLQLDAPEQTAKLLLKFITGSQPIPATAVHRELTDRFRRWISEEINRKARTHRTLYLRVMHPFAVLWNGRVIEGKWNQRNAKDLLLYLIIHHGQASRAKIIRTFLGDLPLAQARNHLRVWISHLNKIFASCPDPSVQDVLLVGEDAIAIHADLGCDLLDFQQKLQGLKDGKVDRVIADGAASTAHGGQAREIKRRNACSTDSLFREGRAQESKKGNADSAGSIHSNNLTQTMQTRKTGEADISDEAAEFLQLLGSYDPAQFVSFREEWIYSLIDSLEKEMAAELQRLLPALLKHNLYHLMRKMLETARTIEPYDGYCDEWLAKLQNEKIGE